MADRRLTALSARVARWSVERLAVLAVVAVLVFALMELAPGDAVDAYLAATGGSDAVFAAELRETFGLTGGLLDRFARYVTRLATLDFGPSAAFGRPVSALVAERLAVTLMLMGPALALTAVIGTAIGIGAGLRPCGFLDGLLSGAALVLNATPGFLIALVLVLIFSVRLGWLPVTATVGPTTDGIEWRSLVLPVATLTMTYLALYVRVARAAVAATASARFILAARARGVRGRRLVVRHRLAHAALPLITVFGLQTGALLGGSVVVETVFAIPGLGSLALTAVLARDVVLLGVILLCGAVMVIGANAAADLLYRAADPRVRAGQTG